MARKDGIQAKANGEDSRDDISKDSIPKDQAPKDPKYGGGKMMAKDY